MKLNRNRKNIVVYISSLCLVCLAVISTFVRLPQIEGAEQRAILAAASLTMSDAGFYAEKKSDNTLSSTKNTSQTNVITPPEQTANAENKTEKADKSSLKKYNVIETQYGAGGTQFENFYVKNTTGYSLDIGKLLDEPLGFEMDSSRQVQVLVMHTHTCESYMTEDDGYYEEEFYPRTENKEKNVCSVGEQIVKQLKNAGIGAVHATEIHDSPSYSGAYYRSYDTIEKYIKKYPNIKVVLDIHRDSIATEENSKMKPTFEYNGKKAAQIMIMAGYDSDGSLDFPDWNYNLRFALRLQKTAETMFPGMTRPLSFGNFVYNMNVNTGSLLIEVGTDANSLEEAKYSGELLGRALSKVLQIEQ